ncbi:723_t:CDS:1, partial [Ambispora leptoticha]
GVIDAGYVGNLKVLLRNESDQAVNIQKGGPCRAASNPTEYPA